MMENEQPVRAVGEAMMVAELLLAGYCLCRLVRPFVGRKEKAWYVGAGYPMVMLFLYVIPYHMRRVTAFGIGMSAVFLMLCWCDRRKYEQKIFLLATFFSLRRLAEAIAEILRDYLYGFVGQSDFMMSHPDLWFMLYVVMYIGELLLEYLVMDVGIRCILSVYVYKSEDMTKKELCMLISPVLTGAGGYQIMRYYRGFYIMETGRHALIYDMLSLLFYAVSIAAVVAAIGLYQSIKANQEEKLQNELLAAQIDSIRHHIGQVEGLYQNIRGMKHDMANHIMTLERLYASEMTEDAREYTTGLKTALAEAVGGIKSGNPVTDVILQEWKGEAGKRELQFCSDFYYPVGADIDVFDVSVILNNALQNAMEHTVKKAAVSIRSYRRNNAYMIEVANSFTGILQWNPESGLPVTSKKKDEGHGYGLSNIRRVARKYAGDIAVDVRDGTFCLSVMLMMEMTTGT